MPLNYNWRNNIMKDGHGGLAIMWFIFGCVFVVYTLLGRGDALARTLTAMAAVLFFVTSFINWRSSRKSR